MKILVLGATGPMGQQVLRQGLAQGRQLAAFVRKPSKLALGDARLQVLNGALPGDADALESALRGMPKIARASASAE